MRSHMIIFHIYLEFKLSTYSKFKNIPAICIFSLISFFLSDLCRAQDYPKQTIKLIVGFPAGGPADIAGRIMARGLQDALKQNVIVENKTGASGDLASKFVAGSAPDGYTILIATASFTLNPLISNSAGYDCLKDFTTVSMLANQANAIAVSNDLNVNSLAELKNLVGKKKLSVATSGIGTSSHITATHLFNVLWDGDFAMIPYRGAGPAGIAVASNEADVGFMTVTGILPLQQQGKLKVLGIVAANRLSLLPNVPTLNELNYKQYAPSWTAMFIPSGASTLIAQKLFDTSKQILQKPETQQQFATQTMTVAENYSLQFLRDYVSEEIVQWKKIVNSIEPKKKS